MFICTTYKTVDCEAWLKPVSCKTDRGVSGYANKMFSKYFDKYPDMVVQVDRFDYDKCELVPYMTYHA